MKNKFATSDITRYKNSLINRAKRSGIYENFGQNEVRKLEDKYLNSTSAYSSDSVVKKNLNMIRDFDNWCMNFNDSSY